MARKSEDLVVWVHGTHSCPFAEAWYKFDLESGKLDLVGELDADVYGSWTAMGEDIFCTPVDDSVLLKHNIREENRSSWVKVKAPMKYPRTCPSLVPVDDRRRRRSRQLLYLIRGNCGDPDWGVYCGELYNLQTRRWGPPLKGSILAHSRFVPGQAVVIRGKLTTRVVFYSFSAGAILFYNLNKGSIRLDKYHHSLRITTPCNGLDPETMTLSVLKDVTRNVLPAATDSSFYWFTFDLYFYAYNFLRKKWLRSSSCLQIPNCDPIIPYSCCTYPTVVHLCNREFIVMYRHIATKLFAIHSFTIDQLSDSLQVTYKHSYPFPDNPRCFLLRGAIATLKSSALSRPIKKGKNSTLARKRSKGSGSVTTT